METVHVQRIRKGSQRSTAIRLEQSHRLPLADFTRHRLPRNLSSIGTTGTGSRAASIFGFPPRKIMAGGVDELLMVDYKVWGIQVMVLLSFTVQVTLLLLASSRQHNDSTVLKFIIWSAYMLADTTAIYALGHMSLLSRWPDQQLMALWAPLLLVHLGGQDNITAYAIEDNRLWLRHLQTFGVQVLAAAYVMYVSSILGRWTWLCPAAILMFVAGFLKYGERVWVLMCASNSASSSLSATSYKDFRTRHQQQLAPEEDHRGNQKDLLSIPYTLLAPEGDHQGNQRDLLFIAYTLLDIPKQLFEGPTRYVKINMNCSFEGSEMLEVVGIQLSMMYDLLYTKAAVVHTWYGRCIRVITLPATVAALLMFHRSSDKDVYHRVDVVVTYVLLGGAVVLEATSVWRAVFSKWTCVLLLEKKCVWLSHVVRRRIRHTSDKGGYMGQHDLFRLCNRSRNNTSIKIARWMGREDWWDSMFYSWSTPVPQLIINKVVELVSTTETRQFDITNSRGRNALRRHSALRSNKPDLNWSMELDLDESILVWHIATYVLLCHYKENLVKEQQLEKEQLEEPSRRNKEKLVKKQQEKDHHDLLMAVEVLSNYMFFLLAARPYMLPYPVSRQSYVQLCYDVMNRWKYTSAGALAQVILGHGNTLLRKGSTVTIYPQGISAIPTLDKGSLLAASLIELLPALLTKRKRLSFKQQRNPWMLLEVISEMWVEMLCYTAYSCNENSHAKHLSSGGEIMTTISLLMIYRSSGLINKKEMPRAPDTAAADASSSDNNV